MNRMMNRVMNRMMNMDKLVKIFLIAGIVLAAAGLIIQAAVASNDSFQMLNDFMTTYGLGRLTPETVGSMIREGINIFGAHYSFYDALTSLGATAAEAIQVIATANAYAMTPVMLDLGIISLIVAAVMFFLGAPDKKAVPALCRK